MLRTLNIENLALISKVTLAFESGFTVITGRTGSGKSMLFNAIRLILGAKPSAAMLAGNKQPCTLSATFDIQNNQAAKDWLANEGIDASSDLTITRMFKPTGRSTQAVNGKTITQKDLQALGTLLVSIQGQHDHLRIGRFDYMLQVLDTLAHTEQMANNTHQAYNHWQKLAQMVKNSPDPSEATTRMTLVDHYLEELDALSPKDGEWETLIAAHDKAIKQEDIQRDLSAFYQHMHAEPHAFLDALHGHIKKLHALPQDKPIQNITQMLEDARGLLQEASGDAEHYLEGNDEACGMALPELESRISQYHSLARKHQTQPQDLFELADRLLTEKMEIERNLLTQSEREEALKQAQKAWQTSAQALAEKRRAIIPKVLKELRLGMQKLGMPYAQCHIECQTNGTENPQSHGLEHYHLWISTNPDQPMQPAGKVASGGEKSRIALVLQHMAHGDEPSATLIFDEADTGISGDIAHQVAKLLRGIATNGQVLCITHLPQVAAMGQWHIGVDKQVKDGQTIVTCTPLGQKERENAVASMMTGQTITEAALSQAQSLLAEQD